MYKANYKIPDLNNKIFDFGLKNKKFDDYSSIFK